MAATEAMNTQMSQNTLQEILLQMRQGRLRVGCHYKFQWFSELIELFGDHRRVRWSIPFTNRSEPVSKTSAR